MKKLFVIVLSLVLVLASFADVFAADKATGKTLRLSDSTGTVTVSDAAGKAQKLKADMKLYSGYTVKTAAKSYAYISLDSSKAVKLDASSEVTIRKSGKKLEVCVKSGEIFFNVSEKLKNSESLNIRTNTMVTGVRGTSGSATPARVTLYDGRAEVKMINLANGFNQNVGIVTVNSTVQEPTIILNGGYQAVNEIVTPITAGSINPAALIWLGSDPNWVERAAAVLGLEELNEQIGKAPERLKLQEEEAAKAAEEQQAQAAASGALIAQAASGEQALQKEGMGYVFDKVVNPPKDVYGSETVFNPPAPPVTEYTVDLPDDVKEDTTEYWALYTKNDSDEMIPLSTDGKNVVTVKVGETFGFYVHADGVEITFPTNAGITRVESGDFNDPYEVNSTMIDDIYQYYEITPTADVTVADYYATLTGYGLNAVSCIFADENLLAVTMHGEDNSQFWVGDVTVNDGQGLVIDGLDVVVNGSFVNNGTVEVGNIFEEASTGTLTISETGSFANNCQLAIEKGSTVTNYGSLVTDGEGCVLLFSEGSIINKDGSETLFRLILDDSAADFFDEGSGLYLDFAEDVLTGNFAIASGKEDAAAAVDFKYAIRPEDVITESYRDADLYRGDSGLLCGIELNLMNVYDISSGPIAYEPFTLFAKAAEVATVDFPDNLVKDTTEYWALYTKDASGAFELLDETGANEVTVRAGQPYGFYTAVLNQISFAFETDTELSIEPYEAQNELFEERLYLYYELTYTGEKTEEKPAVCISFTLEGDAIAAADMALADPNVTAVTLATEDYTEPGVGCFLTDGFTVGEGQTLTLAPGEYGEIGITGAVENNGTIVKTGDGVAYFWGDTAADSPVWIEAVNNGTIAANAGTLGISPFFRLTNAGAITVAASATLGNICEMINADGGTIAVAENGTLSNLGSFRNEAGGQVSLSDFDVLQLKPFFENEDILTSDGTLFAVTPDQTFAPYFTNTPYLMAFSVAGPVFEEGTDGVILLTVVQTDSAEKAEELLAYDISCKLNPDAEPIRMVPSKIEGSTVVFEAEKLPEGSVTFGAATMALAEPVYYEVQLPQNLAWPEVDSTAVLSFGTEDGTLFAGGKAKLRAKGVLELYIRETNPEERTAIHVEPVELSPLSYQHGVDNDGVFVQQYSLGNVTEDMTLLFDGETDEPAIAQLLLNDPCIEKVTLWLTQQDPQAETLVIPEGKTLAVSCPFGTPEPEPGQYPKLRVTGSLRNDGTLVIDECVSVDRLASLVNNGTVTLKKGGMLENYGTVTNNGKIEAYVTVEDSLAIPYVQNPAADYIVSTAAPAVFTITPQDFVLFQYQLGLKDTPKTLSTVEGSENKWMIPPLNLAELGESWTLGPVTAFTFLPTP